MTQTTHDAGLDSISYTAIQFLPHRRSNQCRISYYEFKALCLEPCDHRIGTIINLPRSNSIYHSLY